jgi:lycopene cyclase domain-containing protein
VPEYTLAAVVAVVAVVAVEMRVLRTGLFHTAGYWATIAIVLGFELPVDGWLTKTGAPIVRYDPHQIVGLRLLWGIPVEDLAFGFALVTLVLARWARCEPATAGAPRRGST